MMLAKFNAKVNGINEGLNRFVVNRAKVVRVTGLYCWSVIVVVRGYIPFFKGQIRWMTIDKKI